MNLQALIDQTDLDMTVAQIKAFFLGALCAERPMPFPKAMAELLEEAPTAQKTLGPELEQLWESVRSSLKNELKNMLPIHEEDIMSFMELSKDQLDYFLTALALAGTNAENCNDDEFAELIEVLEEAVEELDDLLTDEDGEAGQELRNYLLGTWEEFVSSKK